MIPLSGIIQNQHDYMLCQKNVTHSLRQFHGFSGLVGTHCLSYQITKAYCNVLYFIIHCIQRQFISPKNTKQYLHDRNHSHWTEKQTCT